MCCNLHRGRHATVQSAEIKYASPTQARLRHAQYVGEVREVKMQRQRNLAHRHGEVRKLQEEEERHAEEEKAAIIAVLKKGRDKVCRAVHNEAASPVDYSNTRTRYRVVRHTKTHDRAVAQALRPALARTSGGLAQALPLAEAAVAESEEVVPELAPGARGKSSHTIPWRNSFGNVIFDIVTV